MIIQILNQHQTIVLLSEGRCWLLLKKSKIINHDCILLIMIRYKKTGNSKTKFLRLFLSAVHRLPIGPTIKNFSRHCPCPMSDLRPGANPIKWGQSYTDVYTLGQNSLPNSLGQIKACKSILLTEGTLEVKIKNTCLMEVNTLLE